MTTLQLSDTHSVMTTSVTPPESAAGAALMRAREAVGQRYVKAALQTGVGGVASRVLGGLAPIILARYLGPDKYGVYTLIVSLVGIFAGVAHLGQNTALQKFLPEYFVKDPARGGMILADTIVIVSGILAVACTAFYLLSGWMAATIYRQASLAPLFRFSALLVLFLSLFNLASSAVAGLQDFASYSKAMVIRSAGFLALAWAGVALLGLYGALGGQVLAAILGLGFLLAAGARAARRRFSGMVRTAFSRSILAEIFSFAFPAFLSGALVAPAFWWANTLLARDSGFAQVGLFGVAFALAQLILVVPTSLTIPAVSFFSEAYASSQCGQGDPFGKLVNTNLRLIWAIALPLALASALFAPWIVNLFFGPAYREAAVLASVMSFVALLMVINHVIGNSIAGSGRMWQGFAVNSFWAALFFTTGSLLIPRWGPTGLAFTFAFSYLIFTFGVWIYTRIALHLNYERITLLAILTLTSVALTAFDARIGDTPVRCAVAILLLLALVATEYRWTLDHRERTLLRRAWPWS
jgi:O-antigen/teichoic acid export membrane protein